jgi:hypothetical protein
MAKPIGELAPENLGAHSDDDALAAHLAVATALVTIGV